MERVIQAVVSELEDKNADWDMIKMCAKIAIHASGIKFSNEEVIEIVSEIGRRCPFDITKGI